MTAEYVKLQNKLRERIVSGEYESGKRIPGRLELMQEFNFARITVDRAIQELVNEGYLRGKQGSGTFVIDRECEKVKKNTVYIVLHRHVEPQNTAIQPLLDLLQQGILKPYKCKFIPIQDMQVRPERLADDARAFIFCQLDPTYLDVINSLKGRKARMLLVNRTDAGFDYIASDLSSGIAEVMKRFDTRQAGLIAEPVELRRPFRNDYIKAFYKAAAIHGASCKPKWELLSMVRPVRKTAVLLHKYFENTDRPDTCILSSYFLQSTLSSLCALGLEPGRDINLAYLDSSEHFEASPGILRMSYDYDAMAKHILNWLSALDESQPCSCQIHVPLLVHEDS